MMPLTAADVFCADVGSVRRERFAWSDGTGIQSGSRPSELVTVLAKRLNEGRSVALGFECPLFVPLPDAEDELGAARQGEGNRAWSAGAGSGALATGLVQVVWVLRELRSRLAVPARVQTEWWHFQQGAGLFLWEAFVSGDMKTGSHVEDARAAAYAFFSALPDPRSAVTCDGPVLSLLGVALIRSGWPVSLEVLTTQCLVVKPTPRR